MDREAHSFADFARPVSDIAIVALAILEIPVASLANLPGLIHQASPGAKFLDALINYHRRRDGAEKHVLDKCGGIDLGGGLLGVANSAYA